MEPAITGVLFDVGGVLVSLNGMPALSTWMKLEGQDETIHRAWMAAPSVIAHETGKIDAEEFATGLVRELGLPVSPDAFLREFLRWPQGPLPGALDLLGELPAGVRRAALSNTSAAHWERIAALGVAEPFEQIYLSHEIGHLKPTPEAFEIALAGMGLAPGEVLFLDDGWQNVRAAREMGLRAEQVNGPADARLALVKHGVLPNGPAH